MPGLLDEGRAFLEERGARGARRAFPAACECEDSSDSEGEDADAAAAEVREEESEDDEDDAEGPVVDLPKKFDDLRVGRYCMVADASSDEDDEFDDGGPQTVWLKPYAADAHRRAEAQPEYETHVLEGPPDAFDEGNGMEGLPWLRTHFYV